jgi:hypothetical protein
MRAIVGTAAVIAIVVAGLAITGRLVPPNVPEERALTVDGLPVMSVSTAIDIRETSLETTPLAVSGWYSEGPVHPCPAPAGPNGRFRIQSEIELYCRRGEIVLAELAESPVVVVSNGRGFSVVGRRMQGPWLDPYLQPFSFAGSLRDVADQPWTPMPIVAVGHFLDHRAADCLLEDVKFCVHVFVIDHVAVANGIERGEAQQVEPGRGPIRSAVREVSAAASKRLGPGSTVMTLGNVAWTDVSTYDDRADPPIDGRTVWLVRGIGRGSDGRSTPLLKALVIDDATLDVLWESPSSSAE